MSLPPQLPPPGWYTEPGGLLRWWDGTSWGPYAPAAPPPTEEEAGKVLAVVAWLGYVVLYGIPALVIRVVERDGNRFARWHAAEALNLQLTLLVVAAPIWVVAIVVMLGTAPDGGPPWSFFVLWGLGMLAGLAVLAVVILGAVRAGQGVWWRCPLALPFLRRHRRERASAA